jgi:hypothetical protein
MVEVDYTLLPTDDDVESRQAYREVVELIGVDAFPEDTIDDPIPGGVLTDGTLFFRTADPFPRSVAKLMPRAAFDEDGRFQGGEIKARVTLTPMAAAADSNVVSVSGLVFQP